MTKEITKASILQQLEDKFKLREWIPEKFTFSEMVIPIYDIDKHLNAWWNEYIDVSITSAAGFTFFTVPQNERWTLRAYDVTFMGAGAYTVAGVYIRRINRTPALAFIYLDLNDPSASASYHIELRTPVVLEPGDAIHVNIGNYISTQDLRLYIDYLKEEIR